MTTESQTPWAAVPSKLSIKVIGVGGAGLSAVEHMMKSDLQEMSFGVVHTNARALAASSVPEKLLLGESIMRGLGTGGDPELGQAAGEGEELKLKAICEKFDLVFIVAGLGGGTATGVAPVLARAAKEAGALVLAIVTQPFEFEGNRRLRQAQLGTQQLKTAADCVICLPHQKVISLLDQNTSLVETFAFTHELLAQGVRGIWQMLTRRGLINVDFADLCNVVRGRQAESSFAAATAEGDDRARLVIEKLLSNPLLGGQVLAEADAVLVSLVGGLDLTMADVSRIMEQINRQAEKAHLVVGAAIEDHSNRKLSVTVVVSRHGEGDIIPLKPENGRHADKSSSDHPLSELNDGYFNISALPKPASRFVPPPPELTPERTEQLLARQNGSASKAKKSAARWRQGQLPLEIISKGRFEKSEPTIHHGEDLDVPTYIRRGTALN